MADFAPELPNQTPQQYLQYSQGYRNDVVGDALTDFGKALGLKVDAIDHGYQRLIKDDLRAQVDDLQNQVGAAHDQPTMRARTPDELKAFEMRMRRFQAGVAAGTVKESNYWATLDASARQMRARYPGYRDFIDETMKEFTGSIPANALVRSLRHEAEQAARKGDDQLKRFLALEKHAADLGVLPDGYKRGSLGELDLLMSINKKQAVKSDLELQKSRIKLAQDQGKLDIETVAGVARQDLGDEVLKLLQVPGTATAMPSDEFWAKRNELALKAQQGGVPSPKELAQMQGLLDEKRAAVNAKFNAFLFNPRQHLGGRSYAQVLPKDKIDAIKSIKDLQVDELQAAITNKDFGLMHRTQLLSEAVSEGAKFSLIQDPDIAKFQGAVKVLGPQVASLLALDDKGPFSLSKQRRIMSTVQIQTMATEPTSLAGELSKAQIRGFSSPEYVQNLIQQTTTALQHQALPVKAAQGLVESLFGQGNKEMLRMISNKKDPEAKHKVLAQLTTPEMAKRIKELSESASDPSMWTKYTSWTMSQIQALNLLDVNTIKEAQRYRPFIDVRYEPQTMTFSVTPKDSPADAGVAKRMFETMKQQGVVDSVARLNKSLQPLRDMAKLDKRDPNALATELLWRLEQYGVMRSSAPGADNGFASFYKFLADKIPGAVQTWEKLDKTYWDKVQAPLRTPQ